MPLHHPGLISAPKKFELRTFFEETVRRALEDRREVAKKFGGVVLIELLGEGGGTWSIDLDEGRVEEGPVGLFDATLAMSARSFVLAVTGKAKARSAEIRATGSQRALQMLSLLVCA